MKKSNILIVILILLNCPAIYADDFRQKVAERKPVKIETNIIDPDEHIYGIPWGTSEDDFIDKMGNPTGYIQLSSLETGMIYGKRHMFFFKGNRLSGVRISDIIWDYSIISKMSGGSKLDNIKWQLVNGIEKGAANLKTLEKILGQKIGSAFPEVNYRTENARVTLRLSNITSLRTTEQDHKVTGVMIEIN